MVWRVNDPAPIRPVSAQEEVIPEHHREVVVERGSMNGVTEVVARAPTFAVRAEGEVEVVPAACVGGVVEPSTRAPSRAGVHPL